MTRTVPAIFAALLVASASFAQSNIHRPGNAVSISGRVSDPCGDPLPKARVTLRRIRGGEVTSTTQTGQEGVFVFSPVVPDVYLLRIETEGAEPLQQTVDASRNVDIEIDVAMIMPDLVMCHGTPPVPYHPAELMQTLDPRPEHPADTDSLRLALCDLAGRPEQFDGKIVTVRGRIRIAFEDFELPTSSCEGSAIEGIWLEYGRGPKRQPTTWCCGDRVPRDRLKMIQDESFRSFHRALIARSRTKASITATLTGRIDAAPAGGFGHFGIFSVRLVIRSVADVELSP